MKLLKLEQTRTEADVGWNWEAKAELGYDGSLAVKFYKRGLGIVNIFPKDFSFNMFFR